MRSCRRTLVEAIYDRDYGRVAGIWRSTSETSEVRVSPDTYIEVTDIGKVQIVRRKAVRVVAEARVNKRSADKGPSRMSLWVFRDIPLTNLSECPLFD